MISLNALSAMIWAATLAGALVPIVLFVLFIIDYKSKSIW